LRVTHTGAKTFAVRRKLNGHAVRISIGKFPVTTVEQAQKKAAEINSEIIQGQNPNDAKRAIREEMTLTELFNLYMEMHAKPYKKSWREDENNFRRYLRRWGNRKLSQIGKQDIQKLHSKIGKDKGKYAANRTLSLLQTVFNRAIDWGWNYQNPADGIKKFKEISRDRFLESNELPKFFAALAKEPNHTARDYFIISLLTGARRTNCLEMRWDQIDFEKNTWLIPDTKNGTPQTLPLMPTVIDILKARRDDQWADSTSEWVFPGLGKTGHLVEPKKAWTRILTRAGIKGVRIHDLRRSLGSWQAATGANLSIIGKTLNHKNVSTTAIYARLGLDPVRESMHQATNAMLKAGGILPDTNVVNIREGKQ